MSPELLEGLRIRFPEAVLISAADGVGIQELRDRIDEFCFGRNVRVEVVVPAGDGKTISLVRGLIHDAYNAYENDLCVVSGSIESKQMGRLEAIPGLQVRYLM